MVKESLDKGVSSLKETSKEWARKVGIDSVEKLNAMIDSHIILTCRKYISSMDADFWKATALF